MLRTPALFAICALSNACAERFPVAETSPHLSCSTYDECHALSEEMQARAARCTNTQSYDDCREELRERNQAQLLEANAFAAAQRPRPPPVPEPEPTRADPVSFIAGPETSPQPARDLAFECYRNHDESLCADDATCLARCRSRMVGMEDILIRAAVVGCASDFVNTNGHKASCRLALYQRVVNDAAWNVAFPKARGADCVAACTKRGRRYLAHAGDHLKCADGTRSPTCTCGRDDFRGCCSHHHGIDGNGGCPSIDFDPRYPIPNTSTTRPVVDTDAVVAP